MKVVKKNHLFEFSKRYPECSSLLIAWLNHVQSQEWKKGYNVIESFPSAILLDKEEVFFEIQQERYYVMTSIKYSAQTISINGIFRKLLPSQLWKGHVN